MKQIVYALEAALIVLTVTACSEGLLSDLQRELKDPVVDSPVVVPFESESTIRLIWETDPGADEYILSRSADVPIPVYTVIYRGNALTYTDRETADQGRYLYTLTKVRGGKLFGPSDAVLGVVSGTILDSLENNNTKETAVHLEWDLQVNLYYYRSYNGEELIDDDWYSVAVPPRRKAFVIVTQENLTGTDSWLTFYLEGHVPFSVISGDGIAVNNTSYQEQTFFFCVSPRAEKFVNDLTRGGGNFIDYTVSLSQITGL